jgi:hypothetical protein
VGGGLREIFWNAAHSAKPLNQGFKGRPGTAKNKKAAEAAFSCETKTLNQRF